MKSLQWLIVLGLFITGCSVSGDSAQSSSALEDTLGTRVRAVFDASCKSCHNEAGTRGKKFEILNFATLRDAPNKRFIDSADPTKSPIYARLLDNDDPMPPEGRTRLTAEQQALVLEWIRAGAPDATAATPPTE